MSAPTSVEAYLRELPEGPRAALEHLRRIVKRAAPGATETIAYGMPALRLEGRFLLSYAAFRDHCSLFPASQAVQEALGEELKPYVAGKGTLRFRADDPMSDALVEHVVRIRLEEVGARGRR
jgi:uncharacterized protein YdhG (YjbR/CyaY superfamily)